MAIPCRSKPGCWTTLTALLPVAVVVFGSGCGPAIATESERSADLTPGVVAMTAPGGYQLLVPDLSGMAIPYIHGRTWVERSIPVAYNPTGEPQSVRGRVSNLIERALQQWNTRCGLQLHYEGLTEAKASEPGQPVVVGWGDISPDHGGEALVGYGVVERRYHITAGTVVINRLGHMTINHLQYVLLHEMGHVIGIDHVDSHDTVMSGPPASNYAVRGTLAEADASLCHAMYADSPEMVAKNTGPTFQADPVAAPVGLVDGIAELLARPAFEVNPEWLR